MASRAIAKAKVADTFLIARHKLRLDGGWADAAESDVAAFEPTERDKWVKLFDHLENLAPREPEADWATLQDNALRKLFGERWLGTESASGTLGTGEGCEDLRRAGPRDEWLDSALKQIGDIGLDRARAILGRWLQAATSGRPGLLNRSGPNRELLRGVIWCAAAIADGAVVERLRQLAEWGTTHRTAQGPLLAIVLAWIESEAALAALCALANRAKKPVPRQRFSMFAEHVAGRLGVDEVEIAERFVSTFDLSAELDGTRRQQLGDYTAELVVTGTTSTELRWIKPDGKPQKSVPKIVKDNFADDLKEFKAAAKDIQKMLPAQRDRIEQLFLQQRTWDVPTWRERYLNHPLVGILARRLIWSFRSKDAMTSACWLDGRFVDAQGHPASVANEGATVSLWHPIHHSEEEIFAWRRFLEDRQIRQPFKQAHREIYLLTDAERQTRIYSNRFAAHIIRQHQFKSLCQQRGCIIRFKAFGTRMTGARRIAICRSGVYGQSFGWMTLGDMTRRRRQQVFS